MTFYTIYDPNIILQGIDNKQSEISHSEMNINGIIVQVSQSNNSGVQVERIISTNPADYLNPKLQPGVRIQ